MRGSNLRAIVLIAALVLLGFLAAFWPGLLDSLTTPSESKTLSGRQRPANPMLSSWQPSIEAPDRNLTRTQQAVKDLKAGRELCSRDNPDKALLHFERAVELAPNLAEAHFSMACVLSNARHMQDHGRALFHIDAALKLKPGNKNYQAWRKSIMNMR